MIISDKIKRNDEVKTAEAGNLKIQPEEPSFKIGSVPVSGLVALAPMAGITDPVFRHITQKLGAAFTVSEMIATKEYIKGSKKVLQKTIINGEYPHIIQLVGCDPVIMAETARRAEDEGAHVIDINMGCPSKKVVGGYGGASLMKDIRLSTQIIDYIIKSVSIPVMVKMRLGWDELSKNADELAFCAQEAGVQCITIHGRTRNQKYKGKADWKAIADAIREIKIPVIANGDIETCNDAVQCLQISGSQALMVGRAAIGRPWLLGNLNEYLCKGYSKEPDIRTKVEIITELYDGLLNHYGKETGLRHARKHLAAFLSDMTSCGYEPLSEQKNILLMGNDVKSVKTALSCLHDNVRIRI